MSHNNDVLPRKAKNVSVPRRIAEYLLYAFILAMLVAIGGHVVERMLGFPAEPSQWTQTTGTVGLVGAAVVALTTISIWPPTKNGVNDMPDSTTSNGIP